MLTALLSEDNFATQNLAYRPHKLQNSSNIGFRFYLARVEVKFHFIGSKEVAVGFYGLRQEDLHLDRRRVGDVFKHWSCVEVFQSLKGL